MDRAESLQERIASLDRIQNVMGHADWRELYLRFAEDASSLREQMESSPNWETFVAARALYQYLSNHMMKFPDIIKGEKEELEAELLAQGTPLPPADYEVDP